jgi:hypothetical protein
MTTDLNKTLVLQKINKTLQEKESLFQYFIPTEEQIDYKLICDIWASFIKKESREEFIAFPLLKTLFETWMVEPEILTLFYSKNSDNILVVCKSNEVQDAIFKNSELPPEVVESLKTVSIPVWMLKTPLKSSIEKIQDFFLKNEIFGDGVIVLTF